MSWGQADEIRRKNQAMQDEKRLEELHKLAQQRMACTYCAGSGECGNRPVAPAPIAAARRWRKSMPKSDCIPASESMLNEEEK